MSRENTVAHEFEEYRTNLLHLKSLLEVSPKQADPLYSNVYNGVIASLSALQHHNPETIDLSTLVDVADLAQSSIETAQNFISTK